MQQLPLFEGKNLSRQFDPLESAVAGARAYTGGAWSDEGLGDLQVDHQRAYATMQAYTKAMSNPPADDSAIRKSYEAMREHVNKQYEYMTRPSDLGGMGITHSIHDEEPYGFAWAGGTDEDAARAMYDDINKSRHIKTLATRSTGRHEFFTDEENDRFRAVHDVFGHAATGRGFSRHGEEAAYRSHRQMFPPEAHAALASETRGQNSYLNYGPGGFPSQEGRLVQLPEWAEGDTMPPVQEPRLSTQQFKQQRLF